jgi:hypothetical protein
VDTVATVVSILFNPMVYATLYFAGLALHGVPAWACFVSWCLIVLAPAALLGTGIRAGWWSDPDVSRLRERRTFLPFAVLSTAVAAGLATRQGFPYPVRLSSVSMCCWLAASTLVSLFWKVSLHVGATTGILGLVSLLFGPAAAAALAWSPLLVAWARLRLRQHTLGQVIGGIVLGVLAVGAATQLVR